MANVLNRTTKQLILSANTPDFPIANWIINPDLSAVQGQPVKYWVINGDTVTLADAPTQAAIDAAALSAARDAIAARVDNVENELRALILVLLDEFNRHITLEGNIFSATAAATSLANFQTRMAAISQLNPRTISDVKIALRGKLGS